MAQRFCSLPYRCSFTFEYALLEAGVPVRHIELVVNGPVFRTNIRCTSAGRFSGPMVVSMRPIPAHLVPLAVTITERRPSVHGAPVHVGVPEALGIENINQPDWGDTVPLNPDELPMFWACGVTPQAVAIEAAPEFMITHAAGHMFVTQLTDEQQIGK